MGMMRPHPGAFLRMEILDQPRPKVSRVAEILDNCPSHGKYSQADPK